MKNKITLILLLVLSFFTQFSLGQNNCPAPSGLTSTQVTQNTAIVTWTNSSTSSIYNIRYHVVGTTNWNQITGINAPFTISGLICSVNYVWQVQQVCQSNTSPMNVSDWSAEETFTTTTCQTTCPAPTNLTSSNVSATGVVLYWNAATATNNTYRLRYRSANSTTWTTLSNASVPYQLGNLTCGSSYIWQVQQICNSTGSNVPTESSWSDTMTFTTSSCPVTCSAPSGLATNNITASAAELQWTATSTSGGTLYNIRYQSSTAPNWITIPNLSLPYYNLNNLSCNTTFTWQVQQLCYNGSNTGVLSNWSEPITFITNSCPVNCVAPTILETTAISATGAVLNWNNISTNANAYNIRYKMVNATNWVSINYVGTNYQLSNLSCATAYVWQVQQICATTTPMVFSPWSNEIIFTTTACPVNCPVPTALQALNISQNSAMLIWNSNTTVNSLFNLRYRKAAINNWTTINNVTTQYLLSGLTCSSEYLWQVQQICANSNGATSLSDWSSEMSFATLNCPFVCPIPTAIIVADISVNSVVLTSNSATPVAYVYNIRYKTPNDTTWTFVNNITLPYQLGNLSCGTGYIWQAQRVCYETPGTVTVSEWSPNMTFSTLACPPVCPPPANPEVSNISMNGAALIWGTPTQAELYNIRFRSNTANEWTLINNVTSPYYQLGNLTCATTYVVQVQQVCSVTGAQNLVSPWSNDLTFSTTACQTLCLAPTGLNAVSITDTSAVLVWNTTIPATANYIIRYKNSNTNTWTYIDNATVQHFLSGLMCNTTYVWQVQQICSNTTGTSVVSPWSAEMTFTTLNCTVNCPAPTTLQTSNISASGAVLIWGTTTQPGIYNLRYKIAATNTWTTITNLTSPYYQLGNLTCATTYVWQVQQVCSTAGAPLVVSPWSNDVTFTTTACQSPCLAPTALETTSITATSAVLVWNSASTALQLYNIRYKANTATTWTSVNNINSPFTLANLNCGTQYIWQVQQICANTAGTASLSPWSAEAAFTTYVCSVNCPAPVALTTSGITTNSAVLHWSTTSNIPYSYKIRYRKSNSNTWITIDNATVPFTLTNLNCSAVYVWQVQQVCSTPSGTGVATLSPWSEINTFTTGNCADICPVPTGLSVSYVSPLGVFITWNTVPGAAYYIIRYKRVNTVNADSAYTTVTSTSNIKQLTGLVPGALYIWQVKTVCSNGSTTGTNSNWSATSYINVPTTVLSFPNPASSVLTAVFWMNYSAKISIQLRDSAGKLIYTEQRTATEGANEMDINVSNIDNGLYFLSIIYDGRTDTSKIVIRH